MPEHKNHAQYLGDGVYAQIREDGTAILTTGTHIIEQADNVIYLEPEVYGALMLWVNKVKTG